MLSIKNLSFSFGNKVVFDNLSVDIPSEHIIGIVGKNGVGKTTLFRIMTNIYRIQKGSITFHDQKLTPGDISFMPTEPYFYPYMKGGEYIRIVANTTEEYQKSKAYARVLDLPLNELVDNYSTGMRKKLAFAALFGQSKPVVILDEPYNGVDLAGNETIQHIITHHHDNKTIILSSHILSTLTDICSDIIHFTEHQEITHYQPAEYPLLAAKLTKSSQERLEQL